VSDLHPPSAPYSRAAGQFLIKHMSAVTQLSDYFPNPAGITVAGCQLAAEYSAAHKGLSLLVMVDGQIVCEDYPHGHPERAHDLASGTKSFAGILAIAAAADGRLGLDEPVCGTLTEWRDDPRRSRITTRHLLQLVSGLESGGKHGYLPTYAEALQARAMFPPGEHFLYGAAPFQAFGEVLRRKLTPLYPDPLAWAEERLFEPLGLRLGPWKRGRDHLPHLAFGAALAAREWAKFGELIRDSGRWEGAEILPAPLLNQCFHGTQDNPAYGLGWWLNVPVGDSPRAGLRQQTFGTDDLTTAPLVPRDLVFAAGAGKQRLYVSRQKHLVVVRQAGGILEALANGERGGFSDREFLDRLLGGLAESPV
jgi:CubicO group peptidase (beta-lactamase class C family)